jgi:nucleotide-binding universal stress UspA family protein
VPLDGSAIAASIIDPALRIMGGTPPELVLLHVIAIPSVHLPFGDGIVSTTALDATVEAMTEYLEGVAGPYRMNGMTVLTEVRVADPVAATVLAVAAEQSVDYIAITTSGMGGVPRAIFGSVADKIVRAAEGAVILWNPPRPE